MENLPFELLQQIASLMDDRSRRFMRLSSTKWFDIIKYNNFTCYFTRPQSLKQITERLISNSYAHQEIGLTFLKTHQDCKEVQVVDSISILTNLTSLFLDYYQFQADANLWLKLTTLTKLKSVRLKIEYPITLLQSMIQLTSMHFNRFKLNYADVALALALNSNVQSLTFTTRAENQLDIFATMANPSRLTRLRLDVPRNYVLLPENEFSVSKLTNLRYLDYSEFKNTTGRCFQLSSLSSLEYLALSADLVDRFAQNTNLTYLAIRSRQTTAEYFEGITKLTKLKYLSLKTPHSSSAHRFLTAMTALSGFELWYFANDIHETLAYLNSRQLTAATITFSGVVSTCKPLQRLTSLEALVIQSNVAIDYSAISALTNLTMLCLLMQISQTGTLAHLTKLKHLIVDCSSNVVLIDVDFRKLPNLERLQVPILNTDTFNSLVSATKLTALETGLSSQNYKLPFYELLEKLPLQVFSGDLTTNHKDELWRALGRVTTLEEISAMNVEGDEKVLYLTGLSRLTKLSLKNSKTMTGQHLTALTSLQVLNFSSAASIFSSNDVFGRIGTKARIEVDNLEMHLPYLYNKTL